MTHRGHGCLERTARVHVRYELVQLAVTSTSTFCGSQFEVMHTSLIEACLVHARNLSEFLSAEKRGRWKLKVIARDYFERPEEWTPLKPLTETEVSAISRKVSHIFCDREDAKYDWPDQTRWDMTERLLGSMAAFVDRLAEHSPSRADWFLEGLNDARNEYARARAGEYCFARINPTVPPTLTASVVL